MSETLAADPGSLVFLPLAEALLARGDLVRAARVAQRGATRHPDRIEAHDLVARLALAQGDDERAEAGFTAVLGLDPSFGTAHRGLGLVRYRQGRLDEAREHLAYAAHVDPHDQAVRSALDAVDGVIAHRDSGPGAAAPERTAAAPESHDRDVAEGAAHAAGEAAAEATAEAAAEAAAEGQVAVDPQGESAARLFDPILGEAKLVALLLDADGLVSAGEYMTSEGRDLGSEIGAHLTGVGDEADRAIRHFKLGKWTRLAIETEAATIAMAPLGEQAVLVAASRDVPLGFVRRTLERCLTVASQWIGEGK
ncbi:MAG: tetratricopeptide repeat protein [Gemmatimonadetes bacterium]|nr:tetratricopeptide repeat protein [Gemmatimonadota bacterium]